MTSLEDRYRRLLALYPRAHRDRYEEEMIAVLLAGAAPGQRRPRFAEALNLLASGVRARAGSATFGLGDRRWRAAAAVAGVLFPMALALKHLRPVIFMYGLQVRVPWVHLGLTTQTVVLTIAWAIVAVAALLAFRRSAAIAAWAAVAVHIAFLAPAYVDDPVAVLYDLRAVAVGLTAAICLTVAEPLDRRFLRTRPGRAFGLAALLALAWFTVYPALGRPVNLGDGMRTVEPWIWSPNSLDRYSYLGLHDGVATLCAGAAVLATLIGVWRLEAGVRRRFLAVLAPVAALVWTIDTWYAGFAQSSPRFDPPVLLVAAQWLGLLGVPLLVFGIAAAIVHRRERTIELLALGRAAKQG